MVNYKAKLGKITHIYDVDIVTTLAMQVENLNKKIDGLMVMKQQAPISHCDLYGGSHGSQVLGSQEYGNA